MLGGFSVAVARAPVAADAWSGAAPRPWSSCSPSPRAAGCTASRSSTRCGPTVPPDAALPRLHKAAHYARRALEPDGAHGTAILVLRQDRGAAAARGPTVRVDAVEFRRRAEAALAAGSAAEAETALAAYGGPLLPEDLYEPWAADWRDTVDVLHRDLLRLAGRWEELVARGPHRRGGPPGAGPRATSQRGDVRAAERQLERMEQALRRELGTVPSGEAAAAPRRDRRAGPARRTPAPRRAVGAGWSGARRSATPVRGHLDRADAGHGSTVLVAGPAGVGQVGGARPDRRAGRPTRLAGRPGVRPPRWRAPGRTPRCSRRSATCAGGTPRSSTGSTTATALELGAGAVRASRRPGAARPRTSGCSSPPPSCSGWPRATAGCCWSSTTCTRPTRRRCGCCTTWPGARSPSGSLITLATRPRRGRCARCETSLVARGVGAVIDLAAPRRARRAAAARAPLPGPRRGDGGRDLRGVRRAAVPGPGGRPRRRGAAASDLAVSGLRGTPRWRCSVGWRCWARRSRPTSCSPSAGVGEDEAYAALAAGLDASVVVPAETGYRFRHALVRERCWPTFSPHELSRAGGDVAERMAALGAPRDPGRPPLHRVRAPGAGDPVRAAGGRDGRARSAPTATGWRCSTRWSTTPPARTGRTCWRGAATCCWRWPTRPRSPAYRAALSVTTGHRAPAGPGAAGPRGHLPGRPRHRRPRRWPGSSSRATSPTGRCCWPGATWRTSRGDIDGGVGRRRRRADACSSPTTRGRSSTWSGCRG